VQIFLYFVSFSSLIKQGASMNFHPNNYESTGYRSLSSSNNYDSPISSTQNIEPESIMLPSFNDLLKQTERQNRAEEKQLTQLKFEHIQLKNYIKQLENQIQQLEKNLVESHQTNQKLISSINNAVQERAIMQSTLNRATQKLANTEEEIYQLRKYTISYLQMTIEKIQKENCLLKVKLENVRESKSKIGGTLEKKEKTLSSQSMSIKGNKDFN
jgi:chromosome segregation ATPase